MSWYPVTFKDATGAVLILILLEYALWAPAGTLPENVDLS